MEYDLDKRCTKFPNNLATTSEFLAPETDMKFHTQDAQIRCQIKKKKSHHYDLAPKNCATLVFIMQTVLYRIRIVPCDGDYYKS
jgi:hypothetical protein